MRIVDSARKGTLKSDFDEERVEQARAYLNKYYKGWDTT
jgi:hypothetical protein